ncbi:MAG: DUF4258 domain-containing protein [Pseudomonadota bacterium]
MDCKEIIFSGHAIRRMFERQFTVDDVRAVITSGETIADYPNDTPYSSCLLLGFVNKSPVHVVAAMDKPRQTCYVITVYKPDTAQWGADFKTRKLP